jgi:hypothetical protein
MSWQKVGGEDHDLKKCEIMSWKGCDIMVTAEGTRRR